MRRQQWRLRGAGLALVPMLALGLVGCGGGGSATAKPSNTQADEKERARKFAQCMRTNGVEMEDPDDDGGGIMIRRRAGAGGSARDKEFEAAMAKCRQHLPNGGKPPKLSPEDVEAMRKFAKCMREHGVDMPDPGADGGFAMRAKPGGKGGVEPDEKEFEAAEKACRHLQPKRPGSEN
ncbi:hypothetical protein [Thermomonospora umbrina]|uniref:Lipoprotein n=1 Tax=Thermomonospora umbrina TaxID=111806 RepID=A0A3D9SKQ0_9ACTN|nr:hypothetical protein [Thermomonospora umbrina]REE94970.1 hypothetical protein DFJ69_0339 [Thermomonospora umbrina]